MSMSELDRRLHDAVQLNDKDSIKQLITEGADVNSKADSGNTALLVALEKENYDAFEALIEKGADVNKANDDGKTPLFVAIMLGKPLLARGLLSAGAEYDKHLDEDRTSYFDLADANREPYIMCELVEFGYKLKDRDQTHLNRRLRLAAGQGLNHLVQNLLRAGADLNAKGKLDATPLLYSVSKGHSSTTRLLIERGADIDARDCSGISALHWAAINGNLPVVNILLRKGADINHSDEKGRTALYLAAQLGHSDVVTQLLSSGATMQTVSDSGNTPFSAAAEHGHCQIMQKLVSQGYRPSQIDIECLNTKLREAAKAGNDELIKTLLELGTNINHTNSEGNTPLIFASDSGHTSTVKVLLEAGANINSTSLIGETPLSWASCRGHISTVYALLEARADVNLADTEGRTPLYWAVQTGSTEMVEALLHHKAKINTKTKKGYTPFDIAVALNHIEVVRQFREHGYRPCTTEVIELGKQLLTAAKEGNCQRIRTLVCAGADINMIDVENRSLVQVVVEYNQPEALQLLIELGVGINTKTNPHDVAALHWAIYCQQEDICQILLNAGAELYTHFNTGYTKTSLELVILKNHPKIVTLFRNEVVKRAESLEAYLNKHETALRRQNYIFHSTIGAELWGYVENILAAKDKGSTAISNYNKLCFCLEKRFKEELKKDPKKATANHKLTAINDLSRFVLGKDLFGEPVQPEYRAEIEDSLGDYYLEIYTQALYIRSTLSVNSGYFHLNDFGMKIFNTLQNQVNIIINSLINRQKKLRRAYEAYDEMVAALNDAFEPLQKKRPSDKDLPKYAEHLNEIFKLVLRKDFTSNNGFDSTLKSKLERVVTPSLKPKPLDKTDTAQAPARLATPTTPIDSEPSYVKTPTAPPLSAQIPTYAGAGISTAEHRRQERLAELSINSQTTQIASDKSAHAIAGAGSGACASYHEQEQGSHFDALEAQAAAFAKEFPMAEPKVPAAGDLLEWSEHEKQKQRELAEQTARDLRATQGVHAPSTPISVSSELAQINFGLVPEAAAPVPAAAAPAPASPSSEISASAPSAEEPTTPLLFATTEAKSATVECQNQAEKSPGSVSTPLFSADFPEVPKEPLERQTSEQSVNLLTLA